MGLKSKLITLCLFVLVGVGVGVANVGAYTPPEELITIDITNIASINDLTEEITYQAIAIPKELPVDKMLEFQLVGGSNYYSMLEFILTHQLADYIYPVITDPSYQRVNVVYGQWWSNLVWSAKKIINDSSPIGPVEAYAWITNDTTQAADVRALIPVVNLAQEFWPIDTDAFFVNNYFLAYYYTANTSSNSSPLNNRYVLCQISGQVTVVEGQYIFVAWINLINSSKEDDYYYYYNTDFEKKIKVTYGNQMSKGVKEYLIQTGPEEYTVIAQLLQDAENVAPGVKFVYKTASNIDPESTYQQGYDVGYDVGYQKGVNDTAGQTFSDLGLYDYIYGIFNAMSMLMLIPVGNTQLGYFILIPLIISTVAFIIGIWKGGQRD